MYFITDSPEADANNYFYSKSVEEEDLRECDLCPNVETVVPCIDGDGGYCRRCLRDGSVERFLLEESGYSKEQIKNYIDKWKTL